MTAEERADERLLRLGAFLTLFGVLSAHALLETARDALFLTHLPAERLPWVYLMIAAFALAISRVASRNPRLESHRVRLIALQLAASAGTLGFWWLVSSDAVWVYYALYVWSGLISSLVIVGFWLALGDLFTITQGKRLYASISTGGAIGALAGFGLATLLTTRFQAEALLVVSAGLFAIAGLGPALLLRPTGSSASRADDVRTPGAGPGLRESLARVASSPYARRVALLVIVSNVTVTLADYLFKSVSVSVVPPERLATWFAGIYLGLNAGSVVVLAFGVTPAIRRLSVHRSLAVLPGLMAIGAMGVVVGGALIPVLLMKAADGALRYSLQTTATELLYLPMSQTLRASAKSFIDIVVQRGAKAAASVGILILIGLPEHGLWIGVAILGLAAIWAYAALELREAYLDVFRDTLREGSVETFIDHPSLDLSSLETLIRALSHPDDRTVLAALDLLSEQGRVDLIPNLVLYHPSHAIVARVLDLFATAGRRDFLVLSDRLVEHEDAQVRAAVVRAMWAVEPQREQLDELRHSECPCIRISAVAGLVVHGWIDPVEASGELRDAVNDEEPQTRVALANAIKLRYAGAFREPLLALTRDADEEVRREAIRAIRASGDPHYTEHLVQRLADRSIRRDVQEALVERADDALEALRRALVDPGSARGIRRQIPQTISRFDSPRAAEILLQELERETSGMIRYRILRSLAPLLMGPIGARVDQRAVAAVLEETLERALQLLHWLVSLESGQAEAGERKTIGGELLRDLIASKERLATQRLFQILAVRHPGEDFRGIGSALERGSRIDRASSIELLENLLEPRLGRAILALIHEGSPAERLRRSGSELAQRELDYPELLGELVADDSISLRGLAMYHVAELALDVPVERLLELDRPGALEPLRERALGLIERLPELQRLADAPRAGAGGG